MPSNLDRRLRPRMTLRQIGVLVAFSAVASAVLAPQVREGGSALQILMAAWVEVPLAFLPVGSILLRRGPIKIWFMTLMSAVALMGFLVGVTSVIYRVSLSVRPGGIPPATYAAGAACEASLVGCLAYLVRSLVPRRCPLCGRLAMLRDPTVPRSSHFRSRTEPRACLACGARFRRERGQPWVDVDTLPDRASRPAPNLSIPRPDPSTPEDAPR